MAQVGTGTLRDGQIRQRCVCPMTGCAYVVRAFTTLVEPAKIVRRKPRVAPEGVVETRADITARLEADAADGGLIVRDDNGAPTYQEAGGQNRTPRRNVLTNLIHKAMSLHTNSTHKSDPASDRAKVPTLARPKLEVESTKAQVELFEQEWQQYCSPYWPEATKMTELKQCLSPELKASMGPAGMSETFDNWEAQMASIHWDSQTQYRRCWTSGAHSRNQTNNS